MKAETEKKHVKVGNTSFHKESIKKMSQKQFKDTYKNVLKGQDQDAIYKEVTEGKSTPAIVAKEAPE